MRFRYLWLLGIGLLLIGGATFLYARRSHAQFGGEIRRVARLPPGAELTIENGTPGGSRIVTIVDDGVQVVSSKGELSPVAIQAAGAIPPKLQQAVVKVVFVYPQNAGRRAVDGIMFKAKSGTWVVTAGLGSVAPAGVPKAIDGIYIEGTSQGTVPATYVYSEPGLYFCRVDRDLTDFDLLKSAADADRQKLAAGDRLTALQTVTRNSQIVRSPSQVTVTQVDVTSQYRLDDQLPVWQLEKLLLLNESVPLGTPLFKNGELVGMTVLGHGWPLTQKEGPSLALPVGQLARICDHAFLAYQRNEDQKNVEVARQESPAPQNGSGAVPAAPAATDGFDLRIFHLEELIADQTAETLRLLFVDDADGSRKIRIASNNGSQTIIVSAPNEVLEQIAATLLRLEDVSKRNQAEMQKKLELAARQNAALLSAKGASGLMGSPGGSEETPLNSRDQAADQQARQLAAKVREAVGADRDKLLAELEQLTSQQFDQRQQHRQLELGELAARVEQMRATLGKRTEQKAEIIKRRLAQLLGIDSELNWDDMPKDKPVEKPADTPNEPPVDKPAAASTPEGEEA